VRSLTAARGKRLTTWPGPSPPTATCWAFWPPQKTSARFPTSNAFADYSSDVDPHNANGDLRLTPMPEICMSGTPLPLPVIADVQQGVTPLPVANVSLTDRPRV
jgi:hypothetical protein